jgi:hypothetical protein
MKYSYLETSNFIKNAIKAVITNIVNKNDPFNSNVKMFPL